MRHIGHAALALESTSRALVSFTCQWSLRARRPRMLVEQCSELLRREDPVALGHELTDLLPVRVLGEQHPEAITAGSRGEERATNGQQRLAFVRSVRNTSSGKGCR